MKMNKKGFTLIELLAVIIILGVLMVIAIPSVTAYISSSRKSAYADTAISYIKAVQTKVNQGGDWVGYDTETLYLVPVSNKTADSCVALESGGASPFSDKWTYAYVGYTANAQGFKYYFFAKDDSGNGINFISFDGLQAVGGDAVYAGSQYLTDYSQIHANLPNKGAGTVQCALTTVEDVTTCPTLTYAQHHSYYSVDDGKMAEDGSSTTADFATIVKKAEGNTKVIKVVEMADCRIG